MRLIVTILACVVLSLVITAFGFWVAIEAHKELHRIMEAENG